MPKFKTSTTADADEDVTTGIPIASEKQMVQPLWKTVLAVSYKIKHTFTIWPNNCAPLHLPKGV